MLLKKVGFILDSEQMIQKVKSGVCCDKKPYNDQERITRYLKEGTTLMVAPTIVYDRCHPSYDMDKKDNDEAYIKDGIEYRTDGFWLWPDYLTYYIRNYYFRLPEEFLVHIRQRRYTVPCFGESKIVQLGHAAMRSMDLSNGNETPDGSGLPNE